MKETSQGGAPEENKREGREWKAWGCFTAREIGEDGLLPCGAPAINFVGLAA
jgi:hypothetical protein